MRLLLSLTSGNTGSCGLTLYLKSMCQCIAVLFDNEVLRWWFVLLVYRLLLRLGLRVAVKTAGFLAVCSGLFILLFELLRIQQQYLARGR